MKIAAAVSVLSVSVLVGVGLASWAPRSSSEFASTSTLASVRVAKPVVRDGAEVRSVLAFAKAWTGQRVYQSGPNCFGTTLAALKVVPKPRFANDLEIREFLKSCQPVKVAAPGDVGVIYDLSTKPYSEVHSFIVLDPTRSFYKNGLEASGAFVTQKNSILFRDFRTGATETQCDRYAAESMEETGLPCPTSVRYFHCTRGPFERTVAGFSPDEKAAWNVLTDLDSKMATAALLREGPRSGETQELLTRIAALNAALEKLGGRVEVRTGAAPGAARSQFYSLSLVRVESFISFLSFSADDAKWSRSDLKELAKELTRARALLSKAP